MRATLEKHCSNVQDKATRLEGVLAAITFIENEGRCAEGRIVLSEIAYELAGEIQRDLDSVNLPSEAAA